MKTKTLLKSLNEFKVRYVVIGGIAVVAHGFNRLTKDIDIFIEPTRGNAERTVLALSACGYDLGDTSVEEILQKKILLRGYILQTDIHPFVTGLDFETAWKNRVPLHFEGEETFFASLDDLIQMKKAAGRPQDLEDLRHLAEIKRQTTKKK